MDKKPRKARRFLTTQWHVVRQVSAESELARIEALQFLLQRYTPALKEFVVQHFHFSRADAEDVVQGFVADRILTKNLIGTAREHRGRFRTFLLTAFRSYTIEELRRRARMKRRPPNGFQSWDTLAPEHQEAVLANGDTTFDDLFVRQVLADAIHRSHRHCQERNLNDIWQIFHARLIGPIIDGVAPESYESLMETFELPSTTTVHNKLASAKRIFRRKLHEVVDEFALDESERDAELQFFQRFLSNHSARSSTSVA